MTDWIACSKQLPVDQQKVIFYVKDRDECFCGFFEISSKHRRIPERKNTFYENLHNWWFDEETITHWMPLQSPPKEP